MPTDQTSSKGLRLSPDAGPEHCPSGVPHTGLFAGEVLRYDLAGGNAQIGPGFTVPAGTQYVWAVFPALDTHGAPEADPSWDACRVGLEFTIEGQPFRLPDQHGHDFAPGSTNCLIADQWNLLRLDLGPLAGRRVEQVRFVAEDGATGHGWCQVLGVQPRPQEPDDVVRRAITTRGTNSGRDFSRGNTLPFSCLPHGFNFLTPVTDARSREWPYRWAGPEPELGLQALAFCHEPSPWLKDRLPFQLMPYLGRPATNPRRRALRFDHDDEQAHPDRYQVRLRHLRDGQVQAGMTPTSHAGFFRFDFTTTQANVHRGVLLDLPSGGTLAVQGLDDGRVAFRASIAPPFGDRHCPTGYVYGETLQPARVRRLGLPWRRRAAAALELAAGSRLEVKAAISFISVEQARDNLDLEVGPAGFDEVADRAHDTWSELLGRLELDGGTATQRTAAWSNLARLCFWPNAHHENRGTAAAPEPVYASPFHPRDQRDSATRTGCRLVAGKLFVNNGYWDTYRTAWPGFHLLFPDESRELLDGIVQQYLDSGWMCRWSAPGHVDSMVGTSSDVIFADAAAHGIDFNELAGYDSALRNAGVPSDAVETGRQGIERGRFVGWVDTGTPEAFSRSIENTISDAALALWSARLATRASRLGVADRQPEFEANARYFANRSLAYEALFDEDTGFFQGRRPDGSRREPDPRRFDPLEWGGDYVETNAWGMAFSTVHDGAGLARLYGSLAGDPRLVAPKRALDSEALQPAGDRALGARLDEALSVVEPASSANKGSYWSVIHEMVEARSLRLGQFGLSNQPAHHLPFMYLHAGQPWHTQWLTREYCDRLLVGEEIGQGYVGDEDNGELSAWQLFAMVGIYPLQPGSGEWVLTSPVFERVRWRRSNGTTLTITAPGAGANRFIEAVKVNGRPWDRVTIPNQVLHADVTIEFQLGSQPTDWGRHSRPTSISTTEGFGNRWQPDRTGAARLQASKLVGDLGDLVDDEGRRVVEFGVGDRLTLSWPEPFRASHFTMTRDDVEPCDWWLEVSVRNQWLPAPCPPVSALWANQTLAFLLPDEPISAVRFTFLTRARLRQVEVF